MKMGKHGISADTPKNILFGSGTYHKNLKFATGEWTGDCIGATSGGGKISIVGEFVDLELDGALVRWKGQTVKQGGKATMEVNYAEITPDMLKTVGLLKEAESDAEGYTMLTDKARIEEGDYLENFGFVGETIQGQKIIVIFDYALCTNGLELETKGKENTVVKATLEAAADVDGDLDTLPVRIYYPETA